MYRAGRYFECHEVWEEVWRSTTPEPKDLIQGLIQIAVGIHHFRRGKPDVAARVLAKGRRRLKAYSSPTLGIDLDQLCDGVRRWERQIAECLDPGPPPDLRLVDIGALE